MARPELIVIGTSAGGLRPLQLIARSLPATFPVCVMAVMHISADSSLAAVLARGSQIAVKLAESGDPIRPGVFYVAPPDQHMLVRSGKIELTRGPRENRARPAIDPLFRSAALAYQERVIGVVLSGFLEDGAAGLLAIKRAGGIAVVQDPQDAEAPSMPESALARVAVDYCTTVRELPALLGFLAESDRSDHVKRTVPQEGEGNGKPQWPIEPTLELEMLDEPVPAKRLVSELGPPVAMACPECGGPLWEVHDEHVRRYRCHMGHGLTASMALMGQAQVVEHSLWIAARALEERATLLAAMAGDERAAGRDERANEYSERAHTSRASASRLRELLAKTDLAPGPALRRGLKEW